MTILLRKLGPARLKSHSFRAGCRETQSWACGARSRTNSMERSTGMMRPSSPNSIQLTAPEEAIANETSRPGAEAQQIAQRIQPAQPQRAFVANDAPSHNQRQQHAIEPGHRRTAQSPSDISPGAPIPAAAPASRTAPHTSALSRHVPRAARSACSSSSATDRRRFAGENAL